MKHKVSELEGALLDAAVAMAEGMPLERLERGPFCDFDGLCVRVGEGLFPHEVGPYADGLRVALIHEGQRYAPSTYWCWGGPLIERERISIVENGVMWAAFCSPCVTRNIVDWLPDGVGPTALTAAMRAYVASKFGEEVELP